jgi:hypothetical protein
VARTQRPAGTNPSPQRAASPPATHGSRAQGSSPAQRDSPARRRSRDQAGQHRGPVAGAAAVAALALAGCGSVTAAQSAAQAPDSSSATAPAAIAPSHLLCAGPGAVSQVAIVRTGLLPRVLPAQQNEPAGSRPTAPPRKDIVRLPPQPYQTPGPGVPVPPGTSFTPAPPRPSAGPSEPIRPRPPSASTLVTSAAKARALAWSVCGLPAFPRVPVNCPALIAGTYRLSFTADGRKLPVVTVLDSGCQTVTGLGTVRTAATRPGFWKLLSGLAGGPIEEPGHLPGAPVSPGGPFLPRGQRVA